MPRKKTKHTQIPSERTRKSTLKRRLNSLFKKANELSILCQIEILIIIHNPNEGNSTLWPSHDRVQNGILKFSTIPDRERLKKLVLQERFLTDKMQDMTEKLLKLKKKNEETETGFLMNQVMDGKTLDELDERQINGLYHLVDEKLKRLKSRTSVLDEVGWKLPETGISYQHRPFFGKAGMKGQNRAVFGRNPITTLMEDMREDKWFSETMHGMQNNLDLFKGTDIETEPTEVMSSFIEGDQGEILGDFNHVWPTIFSP